MKRRKNHENINAINCRRADYRPWNSQAGVSDYTPEQIKEMPRFSSIEQQRCPKARYSSVKKRLACKKEVRVEIFEKRRSREAAQQTNG